MAIGLDIEEHPPAFRETGNEFVSCVVLDFEGELSRVGITDDIFDRSCHQQLVLGAIGPPFEFGPIIDRRLALREVQCQYCRSLIQDGYINWIINGPAGSRLARMCEIHALPPVMSWIGTPELG